MDSAVLYLISYALIAIAIICVICLLITIARFNVIIKMLLEKVRQNNACLDEIAVKVNSIDDNTYYSKQIYMQRVMSSGN